MMKKLILFFCLAAAHGFGQNYIDLAHVFWRNSPYNFVKGPNTKRNFNTYEVDVKLPVVLNDNNVFIAGLNYQYNTIENVDQNNLPFFEPLDYDFASTTLQLGLEHKWSKRSKLLLMTFSRLNTNFRQIDISHFQLGALAFGTLQRSPTFDWKYGVYYNTEFFGPMIVPLFGFNWAINEEWRFKLIVPLQLELSYQPNVNYRTGLRFDGVNGSFRTPNNFSPTEYIDKADNNLWLFGEMHLGANVWFHVKAGHSVLRKYRFYPDNEKLALKLGPVTIGDNRIAVNNEFDNGFSFEVRFIYRLPLDR